MNIQFINDTLGYAMGCAGYYGGLSVLLKTTNRGYNWTTIQSSSSYVYSGFYMINADTGWVSAFYFPTQVTLMTTDGFQTLQQISTGGGGTPATLYFFKEKYNGEYHRYILGAGILSKTTNSGYYWQDLNTGISGNIYSFSFVNKDTGWIIDLSNTGNYMILKTINSGNNWNIQYDDPIQYYQPYRIFAVNNNLIYCPLGTYAYKVFKSTNSGETWGNQYSQIPAAGDIYMIDSIVGFAWSNLLVKTTNGGGPITGIEKLSNKTPTDFKLFQNFPNPFNSTTVIEFDIPKSSIIYLNVFDILGREVVKLIDSKELNTGSYKTIIDFENYSLSSGIYFYIFSAVEKETGKVFKLTKKLIYNK